MSWLNSSFFDGIENFPHSSPKFKTMKLTDDEIERRMFSDDESEKNEELTDGIPILEFAPESEIESEIESESEKEEAYERSELVKRFFGESSNRVEECNLQQPNPIQPFFCRNSNPVKGKNVPQSDVVNPFLKENSAPSKVREHQKIGFGKRRFGDDAKAVAVNIRPQKLQQRVDELQKEIENLKQKCSILERKKVRSTPFKESDARRNEIRKWAETEKAAVEKWCAAQRQETISKRRAAMRQYELLRAKAMREEKDVGHSKLRSEIENLKATIERQNTEAEQARKRARIVERKLTNQIKDQAALIKTFEDQIALLEQSRADSIVDSKKRNSKKAIICDMKNDENKEIVDPIFENCHSSLAGIQISKKSEKSNQYNCGDAKSEEKKSLMYPNGTKKEIFSNGTSYIYYKNGDIKKSNSNSGITEYTYASAKIIHTTYADKTQEFKFPNGQVERNMPNGQKSVFFPDGTRKVTHPNGISEIMFTDGVKVVEYLDGHKDVTSPDGEVHRENADGTIEFYNN